VPWSAATPAALLISLIESRTLDGHTQELIYRPILHA
jgi:hypothetical protein